MNSVVFYEGPSTITGDPIVGIVSGLRLHSKNPKTGDMLQAWILVRDTSPTDAIRTGTDAAVCGDCALRGDGVQERACYVTFWQAPLRIWRTLPRLPRVTPHALGRQIAGRYLRIGAYGDPVAIPAATWQILLRHVAGSIGYTQRWRTCAPAYRAFLMASVLSSVDQPEAAAAGWRTYRLRGPRDPLLAGEVVCPASHEAGRRLTCIECLLCAGTASPRQAHPVIMAHGKPGNLRALGVPITIWRRRPLEHAHV